MSTPLNTHTGAYPVSNTYYNRTSYAPAAAMGGAGALIGAVNATAACLPQVRGKQMTGGEAALAVAKEAAGTGLAAAAGGLVMRSMGVGGFVGLLGMFTVATGVKYFWNQAVDERLLPAAKEEPGEKPKKTAKK